MQFGKDPVSTKGYVVAVVGATGAVGQEMLKVLAQRKFPVRELTPLASSRSAGKKISFAGKSYPVAELTENSFAGVQIALFSAGATVSKKFAPLAAKAGAVVVDNTSAFRMDPQVPLVVPEVNPQDIAKHKGIIANPNCSTIQMVVVLKPLHDAAGIQRVVVSTYQSVSGAGAQAMECLARESKGALEGAKISASKFPHLIAFDVLPHIDVFAEGGYTKEEWKMVQETQKIMGDSSIAVTATCVRVPVFIGHSESVNIQTRKPLSADQARALLAKAPGVSVQDDPANNVYPLAIHASGKDETFVGRIREDQSVPHGLNLWIVSDNLRKGAALNSVQIAEELLRQALVCP